MFNWLWICKIIEFDVAVFAAGATAGDDDDNLNKDDFLNVRAY